MSSAGSPAGTRAFSYADKQCDASIKGLGDLYARHARNASTADEFLHWAPLADLDLDIIIEKLNDFAGVPSNEHLSTIVTLFTRGYTTVASKPNSINQLHSVLNAFAERPDSSNKLQELFSAVDSVRSNPKQINDWIDGDGNTRLHIAAIGGLCSKCDVFMLRGGSVEPERL